MVLSNNMSALRPDMPPIRRFRSVGVLDFRAVEISTLSRSGPQSQLRGHGLGNLFHKKGKRKVHGISLLAAFTWTQWLIGVAIIGVCGLLIMVVLVQQASGGGLVGAFGGGGGGGAFGAKTGDVFTIITISLAGAFLFLTIIGNYVYEPSSTISSQPAATTTDLGFTIPEPPTVTITGPDGKPRTVGDTGATPGSEITIPRVKVTTSKTPSAEDNEPDE